MRRRRQHPAELTGYDGKAYVGSSSRSPPNPHRTVPLSEACGGWIDWYEIGSRRRPERAAAREPGGRPRASLERPVGAGLAQLLDAVAAGGDADDLDAGAVAGLDVAGRVADRDAGAVVEGAAGDQLGAAQGGFGHLGAVGGVGAVAAEAEEAVEAAAGELDVGGGLDVAGDEAEQDAVVDQPVEQLPRSRASPGSRRTRRPRRAGGAGSRRSPWRAPRGCPRARSPRGR